MVLLQRRQRLILVSLPIFLLLLLVVTLVWNYRSQFFRPQLSEGLIGSYTEQDLPPLVTRLLSRGLVKIDDSNRVLPDLAESVTGNPEGTIFTVKLRDNLRWVDNSPLKAEDIGNEFEGVDVSYPDAKTIQYKLSEPFSPFPSLLTKPVFKSGTHIGVGPYRIQNISFEEGLVARMILGGQAGYPDLKIDFFPTEKVAKTALKLGNVQSIMGISDADDFKNQANLRLYSKVNPAQLVAIFYNTKDKILSDHNFRLALSFAAPSIPNEQEAQTSIPPNSWAFNGAVKDYLDNPVQAKNALSKVENGTGETLTLTVTNHLREVGEQVIQAWQKQGIKARLKVESGIPQNFQALLIAVNIPLDPDQYSLWHSTQSQTNISHVSNPRIDKDLEDGRKTTDPAKRKEIYQDFQKVLLDQAPATFLYFPKTQVVYNKKAEQGLKQVLKLQLQ